MARTYEDVAVLHLCIATYGLTSVLETGNNSKTMARPTANSARTTGHATHADWSQLLDYDMCTANSLLLSAQQQTEAAHLLTSFNRVVIQLFAVDSDGSPYVLPPGSPSLRSNLQTGTGNRSSFARCHNIQEHSSLRRDCAVEQWSTQATHHNRTISSRQATSIKQHTTQPCPRANWLLAT